MAAGVKLTMQSASLTSCSALGQKTAAVCIDEQCRLTKEMTTRPCSLLLYFP